MTVSFDEQLRRAFDALADRMREELNQQLQKATEELTRALDAERSSAAAQATREASAAAQEELSTLKTKLATAEREARDSAQAAAAAESNARQDAEAIAAAQKQARDAAAALAVAQQEARDSAAALARAEQQVRDSAEAAARQATAAAVSTDDLEASDRLVDAIREIDRAGSLSEILDTLVKSAGREVARVAMLLVRGQELRGWRFYGFEPPVEDPAAIAISLAHGGILSDAVRTSSTASGSDASASPPFADPPARGTILAAPVLLSGQVVAILYADQGDGGTTERESWPATLEVLARHAARSLEALTAYKAAQASGERRGGPAPLEAR